MKNRNFWAFSGVLQAYANTTKTIFNWGMWKEYWNTTGSEKRKNNGTIYGCGAWCVLCGVWCVVCGVYPSVIIQ